MQQQLKPVVLSMFFLPLIFAILALAFYRINNSRWNARSVLMLVLAMVTIFTAVYGRIAQHKDYDAYRALMRSGNLVTIEGPVQDLSLSPANRQKYDSFTINNLTFQYYPKGAGYGFGHLARNNGPIQQNGIYLRITYDPTTWKHEIYKIEQKINP